MFGGVFCVCIAVRKKLSTITIRVKQVIIISSDGSSAIIVSRMIISSGWEASTPMTCCKIDAVGLSPTSSGSVSKYSGSSAVSDVSCVFAGSVGCELFTAYARRLKNITVRKTVKKSDKANFRTSFLSASSKRFTKTVPPVTFSCSSCFRERS